MTSDAIGLRSTWPLLIGFAVVAVPTFIDLGREVWSTEAGAHAPIVLATGIWLVSQAWPHMTRMRTPASSSGALAMLAVALAVYVFGRAYDFISLQALGVYLVMLGIAIRLFGGRAIHTHAFPFLYLAFLIPAPGWLIDQTTAPLQKFISWAATSVLQVFGYPVLREGVSIFIAQYQLLVEEACSGMNSIVGLTAISLFYIYLLHRATLRYAVVLVACILPVAVVVNLIRVILLVLITYYFGDAAAQGFLHVTAGMVLFLVAISTIFAIDSGLQRLWPAAVAQ